MRSEEDQIAEIKERLEDLSLVNCYPDFSEIQDWLIEAERRAEECVRAEIARDSERLDWVADHQCQFINKGIGDRPLRVISDCMGDVLASSYDLRQAIDAARDVR